MFRELHQPTKVTFGAGALAALNPPPGCVVLLFSPTLPDLLVDDLVTRWREDGTETIRLAKPPGEPMSDEVDRVFRELSAGPVAVVGVGGGSVMDFAKVLALLAVTGGGIAEYEFDARKVAGALPLYLAPTTCGSGSEVTPYAVINNSSTGRKFTLNHPSLRPVQATIDPELLRTLPGQARLATALDAFIHCLEALLTRADVRLIAPLAEAGLKIGWQRLPEAVDADPSDELLEDLARLSLYGGLSILHSRTGLIHTLSVAFSEFCNAPHGLLNARMLPFALAHNLPGYRGLLRTVISRCSNEQVASDLEAYKLLTNWLTVLLGQEVSLGIEPFPARVEHIVRRLMQDVGLPSVSHGIIDSPSLTALVRGIFDAAG